MHYEISYKGLSGKAKSGKAIRDCVDYLGDDRFQKVIHALRRECARMTINRENIRALMFSVEIFCGIQGYPVRALVFHALRTL